MVTTSWRQAYSASNQASPACASSKARGFLRNLECGWVLCRAVRLQDPVRHLGRAHVKTDEAARVPVALPGGQAGRLLLDVEPDQVVHLIAARPVLTDQAGFLQDAHDPPGSRRVTFDEVGQRVQGHVLVRHEPQQTEHPARFRIQRGVRSGEQDTEAGGDVTGVQDVETGARIAQVLGELVEGGARQTVRVRCRDVQGQWQPGAPADDVAQGRLGGAVVPHPAGEEPCRLAGRQHSEADDVSTGPHLEAAQPIPAGHERPATRCPRQKRNDLCTVAGVVEDDQDLSSGHHRAVERGAPLRVGGQFALGRPEGHQEQPQDVAGVGGARTGAEAVQLGVELAVGKLVGMLVRPAQGEPRLADSRHARDHADVRRRAVGTAFRCVEEPQCLASADESRGAGGELVRCTALHPVGRRCGEGVVEDEDPVVEFLQPGAGVDTQLLHEPLP